MIFPKPLLPILLLLGIAAGPRPGLRAQESFPKREFRGVWVTTVLHLDYPAEPTTDPESLRLQYRELLDNFRRLGLNAVIFQVRPAGDALYPSELAPWSAYLTGRQGTAPAGGFDPLAFFVEETHRYGMEFHAWLNPYRATLNLDTLSLSPDHAFHRHRDWMIRYGDRFYFNPGRPEVREHVESVVAELVRRYDLDAVHFDDYFYPYRIAGQPLPDSLDWRTYGPQWVRIDDWRRDNTLKLIAGVYRRIKEIKPHVRFGISPFGVWRNAERDPEGSLTRAGVTTYDDLFADVRTWLRYGLIDYVVPQLYWHIGFGPADHQILLDWWSRERAARQLYIGLAAYKVAGDREAAWNTPDEIPRQIALSRLTEAQGSVFFRARNLVSNPLGLADALRRLYRPPALPPRFDRPAGSVHLPPRITGLDRRRDGIRLRWKPHRDPAAYYYVVYRFDAARGGSFDNPENILTITPFGETEDRYEFLDTTAEPNTLYIYSVTAVNRYNMESAPATPEKVLSSRFSVLGGERKTGD